MDAYIILDIGGTFTRCAVFTEQDELTPTAIKKIQTHTETENATERIISVIREMWPSDYSVKGISMAAPGSVDVNQGSVILAPNIPGWRNINLREIFSQQFQVDIFVNNDARMAAIGEWKKGAGVGHDNLLYFTISTGLGGGVIFQGQILEGSCGIATEVGHITLNENGPVCGCGQHGHLEAFSSGTGIENFYLQESETKNSSLTDKRKISSKEIAELARQGDSLAKSAFDRAGYYLGIGVANYLHIFNPSCVIFGGGVTQSADLFMDAFQQSLKRHVLNEIYISDLVIRTTSLKDNAGLIGAFEYVKDKTSTVVQH